MERQDWLHLAGEAVQFAVAGTIEAGGQAGSMLQMRCTGPDLSVPHNARRAAFAGTEGEETVCSRD
ncbi:hypothetical protein ACFS7Z_25285 [Pontibacter toksunensis]|uniref:Uncharacterized protein n=1 Tax=Pontibacter toksunensis TaxID=1332631 RepID=A0ABW6C1Q4_9BACT